MKLEIKTTTQCSKCGAESYYLLPNWCQNRCSKQIETRPSSGISSRCEGEMIKVKWVALEDHKEFVNLIHNLSKSNNGVEENTE